MTAILFNSLFPVPLVVLTAILVFSLLGWLEVKRNQRFLAPRLLALLLTVFSIVCLILNPSLSTKKSSDIIVLTSGYSNNILDSLLRANSASQVYRIQGVLGTGTEISNYRALSELKGNLFFLGDGVPQYMLEYVDTSSVHYFPASNPEGFTGISSNTVYTANQRAELEGIVTVRGKWTLLLSGPGGKEDSIRIIAKKPQSFSLAFTPKAAGLYLYTLTAADSSGKVRYTEQVPMQVKEQKLLSILFLSDYPTAETRFLKNFLEQKNHKLTLRYKISKDKYRTEFINTPQKNTGRVNENLLSNFDLILTDASMLTSLSVSEISALKDAMQDGLGVLTVINTATIPKPINDIIDLKLSIVKSDSAQVIINNHRIKIPAEPFNISSEKRLFSIQREPSGRMVSGYYHSGLGKSGFQLLTNTFSLTLTGEKEAYAELWSPLIESIARKERVNYDLSFITPFPYYPDEPIEFKIIAAAERPTVLMDSLDIPLVEDPLVKNVWFGKIWSGQSGWNSLHIEQDSSQHNFFVSHPEDWKSLQVSNQQRSMRKLSSHSTPAVEQVLFQPVPRFIFFGLFLLSVVFLWLAPKI